MICLQREEDRSEARTFPMTSFGLGRALRCDVCSLSDEEFRTKTLCLSLLTYATRCAG